MSDYPEDRPTGQSNAGTHARLGDGTDDSMEKEAADAVRRYKMGIGVYLAVVFIGSVIGVLVMFFALPGSFGQSLFIWVPLCIGVTAALVRSNRGPCTFGACLRAACLACCAPLILFVGFGVHGLICVVMALPLVLPLALLGAAIGYALQRKVLADSRINMCAVLLTLGSIPIFLGWEASSEREPPLHAVVSSMVIDATPERVWQEVIAFKPLDEPDEWFFKAGVAYPTHATLEMKDGVLTRECHFSTGAFIEPITHMQEPELLAFSVTAQPPPMKHISLGSWEHAPQLDPYLRSQRGEFRLHRLPDGRTRLTGTTWYTIDCWPQVYWLQWSDTIIQAIHQRVLVSIRKHAEAG